MNRLSPARRAAILRALVDGNSVRATCRLTGAAKGTVLRLLAEMGEVCARFHHERVRGIQAKRIQCDETWSFVGAKAKNVRPEREGEGIGDIWTWVAMDPDFKLAVSFLVGDRSPEAAMLFMHDLADRLATRVQLSTDGLNFYLPAVEAAFGWNGTDYAQLVKLYKSSPGPGYSPGRCVGARKEWVMGKPVKRDVCTSHVERQNLSMRMEMRRFTRLTNAFSKKAANHAHAVALHFVHYNWCRVHGALTRRAGGVHTTPAMAAGLTSRVWTMENVVGLLVDLEKAS